MTRAQCGGGAPYWRRAEGDGRSRRLVRLRTSEWVAAYYLGFAVRWTGAAMAQHGKLLKEQKYDRQLR